jgi:Flp pilus assembly protein CpaB
MKRNLVPLLGIAFVVAFVSTAIFYGLFVGRLKRGSSSPQLSIVVAARNLKRGDALQRADVKVTPWGSAEIPTAAFSTVDQVNGMTLIGSVQENEPILQDRVASSKGGGAGLGIATGMRAISIHATDSSGVVSILRPGHKVDVQLVASQGALLELRTILQDIEVLAVNPQGDGRVAGPVVTLLVDPAGADMAGLGDSGARLRLILRNPLDDGASELGPVSLPAIMRSPDSKK